jgi:hypothetical protein
VRSRPGGNSRLNGWAGNAQVVDEISTLVIAILGIMRDADDGLHAASVPWPGESDRHQERLHMPWFRP